LVHGLGLASSLQAIGLDTAHRFWSLLGFNFGIELAQAAVAGGLGGLAWLVMRNLQVRQTLKIRQLFLVFAAAAGAIWFVERLI
jgi:hypothetical protein